VDLVAKDPDIDLAILKGPNDVRYSVFRGDRKARVGEPIAVVGFPLSGVLGGDMNLTTGVLSATSGMKDDKRFMQISAPTQPGNSGGPALDEGGRVIGVATSSLIGRNQRIENVNFIVARKTARSYLTRHGVQFKASNKKHKVDTADMADRARGFTVPIECWR